MNIATFLVALIAATLVLALSWGVTVGLVYLICLCFGLEWSWLIGTGVWLVFLILKSIFTANVSVNK